MYKYAFILFIFILLATLNAQQAEGVSAQFSMDTINPHADIISPNGGEEWELNTVHNIEWHAMDNYLPSTPITLYISYAGDSFTLLTDQQENDGVYPWQVNGIASDNCRIKIFVSDYFGNEGEDTSSSSFSLCQNNFAVSDAFVLDTVNPSVEIDSPLGADIVYLTSLQNINWTAHDSHFSISPIDILLSLGSGDFSVLSNHEENDGTYEWQVDSYSSNGGKIMITASDIFGNSTNAISDSFTFAISEPLAPANVTITTSNSKDAVISWPAVTQSIDGVTIIPHGYLVLYSETSSSDNNPYYFLAATADLSYTHLRVMEFRDTMYYKVIAYINNSVSQANHLTWLENELIVDNNWMTTSCEPDIESEFRVPQDEMYEWKNLQKILNMGGRYE